MLFCSQQYMAFFTLVFFLYWAMPWREGRVWLLLVSSFYFYACWNHWLAIIVFATSAVDYLIGLGMDATPSAGRRRFLLLFSLLMNLGLLFYFKYVNFFLESLETALRSVGAETSLPLLSVILPIGISFYTFEAINYTVDVYRRQAPAERNLAHFLLFITFFPHLVAGPIVRARDFLPQVRRPKRWDWARLSLGARFFLMGLFKKLAIADRMALFADPVFAHPEQFNSGAIWVAMVAYALQVYCDFSGYSDMAIGSAHMLGYKLAQNFNMPYLSANLAEFWRRWHMSLSSWLRDYVYFPLGGSRQGRLATYRNLFLTMTVCGLWHGASWTYVVFGMVQGWLLIGNSLFQAFCKLRPRLEAALQTTAGTGLRILTTFVIFSLSLIIFRATSLEAAGTLYVRMFTLTEGLGVPLPNKSLWYTVALMLLCHWLGSQGRWKLLIARLPAPALGLGYGVVVTTALLLTPITGKAFIYFQF